VLSIVRAAALPPQPEELVCGVSLDWGNVTIHSESDCGVCSVAEGIGIYPAVCTLDAGLVREKRLCVRSRLPGDRISPTGLNGSKKIQDLLVDEKVPEHLRDFLPVFVCGDEVVWVPGYRISRHFAVSSPDAPSLRITVRQRMDPS
jgi:tRNA(Ile)-lysidine synthetase-like protein